MTGEDELKVEFYRHALGEEEKKSVVECLGGLFLTSGAYVSEFEGRFADYFGPSRWCIALNSCTAALHLSLLALNIGRGDEVITTPMTFIATATAILHTGARPVFVDVEPATGLMDCNRVEKAVTPSTRAILPVHLYGSMCDMLRLREIADRYGLKMVEDSAHCIEGARDGVRPGQLSDAACFSFYATKNLTCGEGGAVVTGNQELADRIRLLRQHGMSREAADRYHGSYRHWDMLECGWKYNMDNIHASILLPQLHKVDTLWAERQRLYRLYAEALSDVPGVRLPAIPQGSKSAHHLFTVLLEDADRDLVLHALSRQEIGVAVNYRAIHLLTYLRSALNHHPGDFPAAEKIGDGTLSLPFWVGMTPEHVAAVVSALRKSLP
ncbi:DegT/DnrJ/EryC1/StrS family aminotransferase [Desulfoferrobacter suflitae]|uniref:DegT/DnrJ/EryC1/StrS family aminotransferase n=1 Tax=Desulfoferrobacter suflitae TaxID=2865782 RepID=UPI0021646F0C|nr:DegT/DnrJ/EryC1/StrS family aminotransferase [Desulfoferrobacter suflitae]MCK8603261.1 DegT/DnrJ/EryC1/StrS family aminotransferase [Desulfoferrobacter suflitae]